MYCRGVGGGQGQGWGWGREEGPYILYLSIILHTNVDHSSFYQLVCSDCLLLTIVLRLFHLTATEVSDERKSPVFLHHHDWGGLIVTTSYCSL